jgi:hypothetical protein
MIMAAGLLGTVAAAVGVVGASNAVAADCPTTMIFEVGGHLDPDAHVYDRSNAGLPGGVAFTQIHYPASIAPYPGDPVSLDASVAVGSATLGHAVDDFHNSCPGAHVTVAGYSEGALVAGDELAVLAAGNGISTSQVNGVLYGDPRRPGVDGGPGGIETNIPTIIPGITMQGPRGYGSLAVQEICVANDGICHSANPLTNFLEFANGIDGYFSGAHQQYDFNPIAHSGSGNTVTPQPPLIPYGPPLPLPLPTLYQLFDTNPLGARQALAPIRTALEPLFGARLSSFPWLAS